MKNQEVKPIHIQRLIEASIKYVDLAEKKIAHEEWKTRTLQEGANLSRLGDKIGAQIKLKEVDSKSMVVFDFEDVMRGMIKAVKPFRRIPWPQTLR